MWFYLGNGPFGFSAWLRVAAGDKKKLYEYQYENKFQDESEWG